MEDIWPTGQSHEQVEERVIELANLVPLDNSEWIYSQEFEQFLDAWWTLAKYYEINTDTVISVETMSEYVAYARLLQRIMHDSTLNSKYRQQAEDQMEVLDGCINEVIKEAVSNRNQ